VKLSKVTECIYKGTTPLNLTFNTVDLLGLRSRSSKKPLFLGGQTTPAPFIPPGVVFTPENDPF